MNSETDGGVDESEYAGPDADITPKVEADRIGSCPQHIERTQ